MQSCEEMQTPELCLENKKDLVWKKKPKRLMLINHVVKQILSGYT